MLGLDELKKHKIEDIQKRTKLTKTRIDDIINKRYEKLERVRVVGFLAILEREYSISLKEWLSQYDKFHGNASSYILLDENSKKQDLDASLSSKDLEFKSPLEDSLESKSNGKVLENQPLDDKSLEQANAEIKASLNSFVKSDSKAYDGVSNERATYEKVDRSQKIGLDIEHFNKPRPKSKLKSVLLIILALLILLFISSYLFLNNKKNAYVKPEISQAQEVLEVEEHTISLKDVLSDDNIINAEQEEVKDSLHIIKITPLTDLWISYVDLESKDNMEVTIKGEYTFVVESLGAFRFGNTNFTISIDGKTQSFEGNKPSRFLFDGGDFKKITIREFNKLIRG